MRNKVKLDDIIKLTIFFFSSVEVTKELVKDGVGYYNYLMSLGDKRVENWGLMYSPFPTIFITVAYLISESVVYT